MSFFFVVSFYSDVPEKQSTLHVEIVNESSNRPGILGGAQVDLFPLFEQKHVEQWVPIVGAQGEFVGHLLLNLTYQVGCMDLLVVFPSFLFNQILLNSSRSVLLQMKNCLPRTAHLRRATLVPVLLTKDTA